MYRPPAAGRFVSVGNGMLLVAAKGAIRRLPRLVLGIVKPSENFAGGMYAPCGKVRHEDK
jgi:hypothetical protein